MRRRELLAGVLGLGAVGGGAYLATKSETGTVEPVELQTINAPGSEAGTTTVPERGTVSVVKFFATWCSTCSAMMPEVRAAHEEVGDEANFVSVTYEPLGHSVTRADVADWWRDHEGAWTVAHDAEFVLTDALGVAGVPTTTVLDEQNRVVLNEGGYKTEEDFVEAVEKARA
jgi:thiol-disulfide isomerase/thioredoxin